MPISVSDSRSNPADQIAHAVEVLGRASDRISIFRLIYHGKKIVKTVDEIARAAKLSRIRVLQEGKKLSSNHIVEQLKIDGQTAYRKDSFYSAHKARILRLVKNPDAFAKLATKTRPQLRSKGMVVIQIPSPRVRARQISVD